MNKMLNWATGAGKTKAALDLIGSFAIPGPSILVLVAERQHIQNWKAEIKKWSCVLEDCCTIMCYASLKKARNTQWDVLVLDECHHASTVKRIQILNTIKADNVIALSATPGDSKSMLESVYGRFDVSKKPLNDLIDNGRLPKPDVFIYDLDLSDEERTQYLAVCNEIKAKRRKWLKSKSKTDEYQMLQLGLKRKRMLAEFKIPYVSYLLNKIWDKRYICFCPTIEIARAMYCEGPIGGCCIDSKCPPKVNEENLKLFNNGDKEHLYVVGMLTEGTNLEDIDAGVLVQLDKTERTMIQKFGRAMRSEHPKMYFFGFNDTIDDELIKNVANNIDHKHITRFHFSKGIIKNK